MLPVGRIDWTKEEKVGEDTESARTIALKITNDLEN
jgi:hypothetical protein